MNGQRVDEPDIVLVGAGIMSATLAVFLKELERCFANELKAGGWKAKLQQMIPSYGHSLIEDAALTRQVRATTAATLGLQNV